MATIPAVCAQVAATPKLTQTWPVDAEGNNVWAFVYERMVANAVAKSGKTPEQVEASYMASYPGCTPNQAFFYMLSDLTFRIPSGPHGGEPPGGQGAQEQHLGVHGDVELAEVHGRMSRMRAMIRTASPAGPTMRSASGSTSGFLRPGRRRSSTSRGPIEEGHQGEAGYGTKYQLQVWPNNLVPQHQETWLQFMKTGQPEQPLHPEVAGLQHEDAQDPVVRHRAEGHQRLASARQSAVERRAG